MRKYKVLTGSAPCTDCGTGKYGVAIGEHSWVYFLHSTGVVDESERKECPMGKFGVTEGSSTCADRRLHSGQGLRLKGRISQKQGDRYRHQAGPVVAARQVRVYRRQAKQVQGGDTVVSRQPIRRR